MARDYAKKKNGSITIFGRDPATGRRRIFGNLGIGRKAPDRISERPVPRGVEVDREVWENGMEAIYGRLEQEQQSTAAPATDYAHCPDFNKRGHDVKTCAKCTLFAITQQRQDEATIAAREAWIGSPFEKLVQLSSKAKGALGEDVVEGLMNSFGFQVDKPESMEHDRIINGHKVEIKMSTLWEEGKLQFSQIRDQDYEYVIFLGIEPFNTSVWILPKAAAVELSTPQHGGSKANETRWYGFQADDVPEVLAQYGGDPNRAREVALKYFGTPTLDRDDFDVVA